MGCGWEPGRRGSRAEGVSQGCSGLLQTPSLAGSLEGLPGRSGQQATMSPLAPAPPSPTEVKEGQELTFAFRHLLCARPGLGAECRERPWGSDPRLPARVHVGAPSPASCVVLDKSLSLSVARFPPW